MKSDDSVPGWDAIDAALKKIYGSQEPKHYGTTIKFMLGGHDPLDGISIYEADGGTHWHYVSYGMTELYTKDWENKEFSGWGFEFTMRLAKDPEDVNPPGWPMNMMQNLARYVFNTGNIFDEGHHLNCNGPIALKTNTELRALFFVDDPELPEIKSPHGKLKFIQLVGITLDERHAIVCWNSMGMKKLFAEFDPLFITRLDRTSILKDELAYNRYDVGVRVEGSSTGALYTGKVEISILSDNKTIELVLGANGTGDLLDLLRGRLFHGRELTISTNDCVVSLKPGEQFQCNIGKEISELVLPVELCEEMRRTVKPIRGLYRFQSNTQFILRVVPSEIKDQKGKVIEIIG